MTNISLWTECNRKIHHLYIINHSVFLQRFLRDNKCVLHMILKSTWHYTRSILWLWLNLSISHNSFFLIHLKKKIPVRSNPEIVPVLGKQFPKHGLKWHKKDQNCHACKAWWSDLLPKQTSHSCGLKRSYPQEVQKNSHLGIQT